MKRKVFAVLGLAALASGSTQLPAKAQSYAVQTVLTGLFSPRGLTFDSNGTLYVAEGGVGGNGPSIIEGTGASVSYGETSAVTRWQNGVQTRVLSNLPSLADRSNGAPGASATGLQDIVFVNGAAYGVLGYGGNPLDRASLVTGGAANGSQLGTLVRLDFGGSPAATVVADLSAYEAASNPDLGELNNNPFGLTPLQGGGFAVADAGANAVVLINAAGAITGSVALPAYTNPIFDPSNPATGGPTYQAVPTGAAEGPDGTLYVTELSGYPFLVGGAHIDVIQNGAVVNRLGGFTNLTDITYANGKLYALQLTTNGLAGPTGPGPGQLLSIDPLTGVSQVLYSGLTFPGGLAIGPDGSFYISSGIMFPGGGSVVRVTAVPEPGAAAILAGMSVTGAAFLRRRKRRSNK